MKHLKITTYPECRHRILIFPSNHGTTNIINYMADNNNLNTFLSVFDIFDDGGNHKISDDNNHVEVWFEASEEFYEMSKTESMQRAFKHFGVKVEYDMKVSENNMCKCSDYGIQMISKNGEILNTADRYDECSILIVNDINLLKEKLKKDKNYPKYFIGDVYNTPNLRIMVHGQPEICIEPTILDNGVYIIEPNDTFASVRDISNEIGVILNIAKNKEPK